MSLCCNTVRVERVKGVGFKTRPRDPWIMGYVLSPTAVRFWVRSRCVTPVTLGRSPTSSVCEGSRDARLDVCGAGTRVILSAKSETFWCLMSIPTNPCWAMDRAWGERSGTSWVRSQRQRRQSIGHWRTASCTRRSLPEQATHGVVGRRKPAWWMPDECASMQFRNRPIIKYVRVGRAHSVSMADGWLISRGGETPVVAAAMRWWWSRHLPRTMTISKVYWEWVVST